MRYKYYSTQRPVTPGAYPKPKNNPAILIHNFSSREYVPEIGRQAWGYVELVFDYYRDTAGAWWFENRALLPSGDIVSMDMYLFGYEGKRKKGERQQWRR